MRRIRQSADSCRLMERKAAKCFEEAYPIGNGSMGAMIYGDTQNEIIGLNNDTLWTGYPRANEFFGDGAKSLDKAKKMILSGDYSDADNEISNHFGSFASDAYLPLGELTICMKDTNKICNYSRILDLKKAVVSVKYRRGNVKYSIDSFASNPDEAVVYRINTNDKSGKPLSHLSLTIGLRSELYSKTYTENDLLLMEGECPVTSEQNILYTNRKIQYFDEDEKRGIRFLTLVHIITDGKKLDMLNKISVSDASFCEIRIFVSTSFNGYDKHPYTKGRDYKKTCFDLYSKIKSKKYDEILASHIRDYTRFFKRVKIDFGSDNRVKIPTSERLRRFESDEADRALPALLFNFGRYLTISSSRKGSQATNLQGIWNNQYMPPWHSNYTVNINTEMNYFPTLALDLTEMYEPLIRLIKEVSETGKITAKHFYRSDGWCCHHNTDLWRHTQPVSVVGYTQCFFWSGAGGWLCRHLFEYYEYTKNKKFLEKTAYPIIKGAVEFYLSQLRLMDGYEIVFPSTSPESAFWHDGKLASVSETSEITMAIVRELFSNYVKICEILCIENDALLRVQEKLPRLLPIRISPDGRIMEWYRNHEEVDVHHRHLSHLYSFYPSRVCRPDNEPELCSACRKTLEAKGDDGTGWSISWKASLYASLWDGEKAYTFIKKQLRLSENKGFDSHHGGGSYPNMFGSCPPFQIDSNFGTVSSMIEMLIQSDMDTIHLIPAIPKSWSNISISGIRAKGNRKVSLAVKNGNISECIIIGDVPSAIYIKGEIATEKFIQTENGCIYNP